MVRGARLDTATQRNVTVSATTAQVPTAQTFAEQTTDPFADNMADEYGEIVPIPMPPLAHPAGELVHPWTD